MRLVRQLLSLISVLLISIGAIAQTTFFNNGSVTVMPGAIVQINGNLELNGANNGSTFDNNGDVTVATSTNPGDVFIISAGNSAVMQGNGATHVEGDWINDGSFLPDASTVFLFGSNQLITGGQPTTFNNLTLLGSGVKRQTINAFVNSNLALNDRELATDSFTMSVLNTATTAVSNIEAVDTGFVSSLLNGALSWTTGGAGAYFFPLGSSLNTVRYRPVQVDLSSIGNSVFAMRLVNNNATIDTYNAAQLQDSLCRVDSLYYHEIHRNSGASPVKLTMYYLTSDGNFDAIGEWGTPQAMVWNKAGNATASVAGGLQTLTIDNWNDFSEFPFILAEVSPNGPIISGITEACESQTSNFTLTPNNSNSTDFNWSVTAVDASLDAQMQGTTNMDVTWGASGGQLSATEISPSGCVSFPSLPVSVTLFTAPTAAFTYAINTPQLDVVNFADSSSSAFAWEWDYGDGNIASIQNPSHEYDEVGVYNVMLAIEDENGCVDTVYNEVLVNEGGVFPGVFSPNGDGVNDVFVAGSAGVKEYNLSIYNRWGELVFESNAPKAEWTGRTFGGEPCTPGTYFYLLRAIGVSGKDYSRNGYITLLK